MVTIWSMSGLPARIPAVSSNARTLITACGKARRKLAIRGVEKSTSPRRRRVTTRMRGRGGRSSGFIGLVIAAADRLAWPRDRHAACSWWSLSGLADLGGTRLVFGRYRKSALRRFPVRMQHLIQLAIIFRKPAAIGFGVP